MPKPIEGALDRGAVVARLAGAAGEKAAGDDTRNIMARATAAQINPKASYRCAINYRADRAALARPRI